MVRAVNNDFLILGNCVIPDCSGTPLEEHLLILDIQKRYSFRISEVLSLNIDSLQDDFNICVKLSKCKEYCYIRDEEIYNRLKSLFSRVSSHTFTVSYKNYYRYLKMYHSEFCINTLNKNSKVTHSFRYVAVKKLSKITNNKKIIQAKLRHKSILSQDYYLSKQVKIK